MTLDHNPADVLRELVQNDFDAGGTEMEVRFTQDEMIIKGNGAPIVEDGGTGYLSAWPQAIFQEVMNS